MRPVTTGSPDEADLLKRPWTPFVRCAPDADDPDYEIFRNSRYQVHRRRFPSQDGGPDLVHLSFKRLDQGILIPWRDKMRIKHELVGEECEGIELFPARSREVDLSNQFHLWVIDSPTFRFPVGFAERAVSDVSLNGAKQEPWAPGERPADCLPETVLRALMKERKRS